METKDDTDIYLMEKLREVNIESKDYCDKCYEFKSDCRCNIRNWEE